MLLCTLNQHTCIQKKKKKKNISEFQFDLDRGHTGKSAMSAVAHSVAKMAKSAFSVIRKLGLKLFQIKKPMLNFFFMLATIEDSKASVARCQTGDQKKMASYVLDWATTLGNLGAKCLLSKNKSKEIGNIFVYFFLQRRF